MLSQPVPQFSIAQMSDIPDMVALIDSVYRGENSRKGWTTEADFLDGQRTDKELIQREMSKPDSLFLLIREQGRLLASVHLEKRETYAYLGMLSVDVNVQNKQLGRRILEYAEGFIQSEWNLFELRITVLHLRPELIAWYERRGFKLTGAAYEFPRDVRMGQPKVPHLELLEMQKILTPRLK